MKKCSKCKTEKELDCFSNDKKSLSGKQSWCKECKLNSLNEYYKNKNEKRSRVKRTKEQGRERYYKNRLSFNISRKIRYCLKGKKNNRWEILVGYTINDLKKHLESLFDEKMNWSNYGTYWHIDHKRPISSFNITDCNCDDFKNCWSLNNLQPLEKTLNMKKSDKF